MVAKWFDIDLGSTISEVNSFMQTYVFFAMKFKKNSFTEFNLQVDSYYSKALNTPDGNRRLYYASYLPGFDLSECEPPEITRHLDKLCEVEIDLQRFNSKALCCLICKYR